jgi:hypothetical protein
MGRAHFRYLLRTSFLPDQGAEAWEGALDLRLTFFSPAAYSLRSRRCRSPRRWEAAQGNGSLRYLFEEYAFDTDRRELHRGADVVTVAPQVFDLLDYLIRNRQRVVKGRPHQRHLERPYRLRRGADDPPECRSKCDRRFRRGTAPHQNPATQGLPFRRYGAGSAGSHMC